MKPATRNLRQIYCASACKRDWRKKQYRSWWGQRIAGQRYAEEVSPGVWMCLCCGKRV